MRWKPPSIQRGVKSQSDEEHIGWRVEFRSMDIQLTDFENAAFVAFIVLLSRVILGLGLDLYIPISKLEENMRVAHRRGAAVDQKFWTRKSRIPCEIRCRQGAGCTNAFPETHPEDMCEQRTIAEILVGTPEDPGLVPLCRTYLDFVGCDGHTRDKLDRYMDFLVLRAKGEVMTAATWMRKFIREHPDYKHDSRIPKTTAYDLMVACKEIGNGERECPELLGPIKIEKLNPAANPLNQSFVCGCKIDIWGKRMDADDKCCKVHKDLLKTYFDRAQAHNLISLREEIVAMESRMQADKDNYQRMHQELCHNARKAGLRSQSLFCPDFQTDSLLSNDNPLNMRFASLGNSGLARSPPPRSPSASPTQSRTGPVRDYSRSLLADVPSVAAEMHLLGNGGSGNDAPGSPLARARAAQQVRIVAQANEQLQSMSLADVTVSRETSFSQPKSPDRSP